MPPELQPIKRTGKTHVPVRSVTKAAAIDDLGIATVSSKLYRDLLEMLDDRHGHGATLIP